MGESAFFTEGGGGVEEEVGCFIADHAGGEGGTSQTVPECTELALPGGGVEEVVDHLVAADAVGTITLQAVGDLALREIGVGVDSGKASRACNKILVVGSESIVV